ncbi:DUF2798 domain-containing protein [Mucilaginibacter gilvus]|uniref:DUF2798 domain-containing protein n=1 Tax=Mucilaginibacter gilvus TaxID=2305909 RepID=A0A3S3WXP8_9SPHI|nr:DUF2798 domain-containing protein [Mucilaginibacter gilvus]RWY46076.1 DUF2798 domain-containing protein [Mucilaginibacter gilvus]
MENKRTHEFLTKPQGYIITIILISVFMTAAMSLGMLLINLNEYTGIFSKWRKDFLNGCLIALPAGFILVPGTQKIIDFFTVSDVSSAK